MSCLAYRNSARPWPCLRLPRYLQADQPRAGLLLPQSPEESAHRRKGRPYRDRQRFDVSVYLCRCHRSTLPGLAEKAGIQRRDYQPKQPPMAKPPDQYPRSILFRAARHIAKDTQLQCYSHRRRYGLPALSTHEHRTEAQAHRPLRRPIALGLRTNLGYYRQDNRKKNQGLFPGTDTVRNHTFARAIGGCKFPQIRQI